MPDPAGRRDAALTIITYETVRHLPHTGRDHGRLVSKDGDQWSPG
jgi:hypothetical protein